MSVCPLWGHDTSEWLEQGWVAVAAPSGKLHPTTDTKLISGGNAYE
jgi:hypothetical protein